MTTSTTIRIDELWRKVRERLAADIPAPSFDTWYADMRPRALEGGQLELGVPSLFIKKMLKNQGGLAKIAALASEAAGRPLSVRLVIDGELYRELQKSARAILHDNDQTTPDAALPPAAATAPAARQAPPPAPATDPSFRFDTLLTAPENLVAVNVARAIAEATRRYPLFTIHGRAGTGKTHLLHALCHHYHTRRPEARVLCVSAREWVDSYSEAWLGQRLEAFRREYRECDLLAVDELQVLLLEGDKKATKNEFMALLDHLLRAGKTVVLAGSGEQPPAQWPGLNEALRSRLAGGLAATMDMPGGAERVELARRKAAAAGLPLTAEVARALAEGAGDVRGLEGAVLRLEALVKFGGAQANVAAVRLALRGDGRPGPAALWTVEDVAKAVAETFGVALADLRGRKRLRTCRSARTVAAGLARGLTGASLAELGAYLDRRSHATVSSLLRGAAKEARQQRGRTERVLLRLGVDRRLDELFPEQAGLFDSN